MAQQMSLIPVSQREFTGASYDLEELLQAIDDENESWDEAKTAHNETLVTLKQGVAEKRAIIKRAKQEHREGINEAQVNALMNEAKEREG